MNQKNVSSLWKFYQTHSHSLHFRIRRLEFNNRKIFQTHSHNIHATGALSTAERSHPTSEVRGRSREDPMPEGRQPRGVTPCLRSGAAAESTRLRQCRNRREVLPRIRGRGGGRLRGDTQHPRSGAATRGVTPCPRSGAVAGRIYHTPQAQGQGRRVGGATPRP